MDDTTRNAYAEAQAELSELRVRSERASADEANAWAASQAGDRQHRAYWWQEHDRLKTIASEALSAYMRANENFEAEFAAPLARELFRGAE